jgi:sugar phosphate isomerase/epimerase
MIHEIQGENMARDGGSLFENTQKVVAKESRKQDPGRLLRCKGSEGANTGRKYSLAHLTVIGCTPPEVTYIAARAGYDFVSLRLIPMGVEGEYKCISKEKDMIRETRQALEETGIKMLDLELARILDNVTPETYLPAMEVAAELGARHIITSAWTQERNERNFIIDRYAEICDLAAPLGLTVDLEFPSFSSISSLRDATDVVRAAERSNGGILIDTLYLYFSGVSLDELEKIPTEWLHFMHICDTDAVLPTTLDEMRHVARDERKYFGEGRIDFPSILSRVPLVPFSIELPNIMRTRELGYEEHAKRCLQTARQYLEGLESKPSSVLY